MISFPEMVLDNPVWYALQTVHQPMSLGTTTVQRYPTDILRMIGCENPAKAQLSEIEPWIFPAEKIYLVGELASMPPGWKVAGIYICTQMLCTKVVEPAVKSGPEIIPLEGNNLDEMLELIRIALPGFFFTNTPSLGDYYGIFNEGKLVAMAGERLKIKGYTEVSAVCTHPDYRGNGYAQALVAFVSQKVLDEGTIPFLHYLSTNTRARSVYDMVGYTERRLMPFNLLEFNTGPAQ